MNKLFIVSCFGGYYNKIQPLLLKLTSWPLITCLTISFYLDVNPARLIFANIFCWCSLVAFDAASVFFLDDGSLVVVFWLVLFLTAWLDYNHLLPLCGLRTMMLFGLNFTGRGIIELMYSALPTMVFFINTMS